MQSVFELSPFDNTTHEKGISVTNMSLELMNLNFISSQLGTLQTKSWELSFTRIPDIVAKLVKPYANKIEI